MELVRQIVMDDEHDSYPVHEEDHVPETPRHVKQWTYFMGSIQARRPDVWVTADTCLYWEPKNMSRYVAPDISVIACPPPAEPPNVYLAWRDPPLLFVAEVGSRSTLVADTGPKLDIFGQLLKVPEYMYTDPPKRDLRLWRLEDGQYRQVPPDAQGRVWSAQLELGFGFDETDFLRVYDVHGNVLLTHEEENRRADSEAERARIEAARANSEAERADNEVARRMDAEQRLAELTAELDRLRRQAGSN